MRRLFHVESVRTVRLNVRDAGTTSIRNDDVSKPLPTAVQYPDDRMAFKCRESKLTATEDLCLTLIEQYDGVSVGVLCL